MANRCVQSTPCPAGKYRSSFGECRFYCKTGDFWLDNLCYSGSCPAGYTTNIANRVCVQEDTRSGCTLPYYLQGARCVFQCDPGFFPNNVNRVCESCSSNCQTCSSKTSCSSCMSGFDLSGRSCVFSEGCSGILVRHRNQCITSCPSGTANINGFCVRNCPEGSYFWNQGCY